MKLAASFVDDPLRTRFILLCVAGPLVIAGLVEDFGIPVSTRDRFIASAASSAFVMIVVESWPLRLDIPFVDAAMQSYPVAAVAKIVAGAALSHSFNFIGILNGLCLGVALSACAACPPSPPKTSSLQSCCRWWRYVFWGSCRGISPWRGYF